MKTFLKIVNGNVEEYNLGAQRIKYYYFKSSKGEAVRADWFDETDRSIQVQLTNGKILIINRECQVVKII